MNRLDWKCLWGSLGAHLALLLTLLVAPGFFTDARREPYDAPPIEIIPAYIIDGPPGGGAATPGPREERPPAAPAPAASAPAEPAPRPVTRETPPPDPVEPAPKPAPRAVTPPPPRNEPAEIPDPPKNRKPVAPKVEIDFSQKTKVDSAAKKKAREQAAAKARAEEQRAQKAADDKARREWESKVGGLAKSLAGRLSGSTSIEAIGPPGGGGGGAGFANYDQVVKKVYSDAWIEPDDVTDELATVRVQVTIRRDGSVDRAGTRVLRRSGIPSLDRSVQATLDRVTSVLPFPAGARDESRSYTINFNLRSMRSDG